MKCKRNISQVVDWKWWLAGPVHCGQRRSGVTFQSADTHTDTLLTITHAHKLSIYYTLTHYGYLGCLHPRHSILFLVVTPRLCTPVTTQCIQSAHKSEHN